MHKKKQKKLEKTGKFYASFQQNLIFNLAVTQKLKTVDN